MTTKAKKIRARFGLGKLADGDVQHLLDGSLKGLTDNAAIFPKPPVELSAYQSAIAAYDAAIPAALDGSKTAIAHKNKLRDAAVRMYVQLAHYVEANCNDDLTTFLLSGFQPAASTKTPPEPLAQPAIDSVVPGPLTGQLKIKVGSVPKAKSYHIRWGAVPNGSGQPASWTDEPIPTGTSTIISNLTPGITYTFQVRALGRMGYTNWSDPVSRMAT